MGAKIGRRIYWPGSGIQYCPDPELLEIGDDVVFGLGPVLMTTDSLGTAKIVVEDGGEEVDEFVGFRGSSHLFLSQL